MSLSPEVIHPKERSLKPLVFTVSGLAWAVVVCSLVGLFYGLLLIPFVLMGHAYFLGHVRGQGVRVSDRQLPELYARITRLSTKLGLAKAPDVYVLQAGGVLNAFATKLFSREYIILYSDLIDSCNTDEELDFVIAHELGHHAAGHLRTHLFLLPSRLIPLLGPAYSRACEYTCDRAGLFAVEQLEPSRRALAVLAAGKSSSQKMDLAEFENQQLAASEFWPAVAEVGSSHPYLPKRIAELSRWQAQTQGGAAPMVAPGRPFFSYVLGMFMSPQSFGVLLVVYIVGIMAAVAIPNFKRFQERAAASATKPQPGSQEPVQEPEEQLEDETP